MIEDIPTVPVAPEGSATISALATLWGLTKGTIRNYIDCGDLQAVRVPNEGGYSFTIYVVNPPTLKPYKPRGNPALLKPAEPEAPKKAKGKAAKPSGRKIAPFVESEPAIRPGDIGEALALLKTGAMVSVGLPVEGRPSGLEAIQRWEAALWA